MNNSTPAANYNSEDQKNGASKKLFIQQQGKCSKTLQ